MLYKLLWEVLDTQYNQNISSNTAETSFKTMSLTFNLDSQLLQWKQEVPQPFTIMTSFATAGPQSDLDRLSVVLSLRFLNVRILLHRPALERYLENLASPPITGSARTFVQEAGKDSLRIAIDSAKAVVDIVHGALSSSVDGRCFLGAWWFTVYYSRLHYRVKCHAKAEGISFQRRPRPRWCTHCSAKPKRHRARTVPRGK